LFSLFITTLFPYWETDRIIKEMGQKAYLYSYSGIWQEVQDYLELYQNDPLWFLEKYLTTHSINDLFGNFFPRVEKTMNRIIKKPETMYKHRLPPVRYPHRKRGYDDKGTLRAPHERHGDPPIREKVDKRDKINHPLLNFKVEENYIEERTLPEEEKRYEQENFDTRGLWQSRLPSPDPNEDPKPVENPTFLRI